MKEPILSREEVETLAHRICMKYVHSDNEYMRQYTFGMLTLEQFAQAYEAALLEKLCGEPAAWITWQSKDGKQKLEYGCIATNPEYCKAHDEWLWTPLYTLKDRQS
ncbi:hypothetical protein [Burkholderia cenocepacia]|uniref:hypothetical protein n=1 Tax=Burkholderia cenocepacia TaxID=95486 RepID=UPI001B9F24CB|nr:hypothetical protein [Burkholderia cenocepacia]MBR8423863.1 hypothetical protein [Burkholderia cenocepacia]